MKHIKSIFEYSEDEEKIPWAEVNRLGSSSYKSPVLVTKDNLPKPGDKLRCIPGFTTEENSGGGGYVAGRVFLVKKVTHADTERPIVWPNNNHPVAGGSGVYFNALEYVYDNYEIH